MTTARCFIQVCQWWKLGSLSREKCRVSPSLNLSRRRTDEPIIARLHSLLPPPFLVQSSRKIISSGETPLPLAREGPFVALSRTGIVLSLSAYTGPSSLLSTS